MDLPATCRHYAQEEQRKRRAVLRKKVVRVVQGIECRYLQGGFRDRKVAWSMKSTISSDKNRDSLELTFGSRIVMPNGT